LLAKREELGMPAGLIYRHSAPEFAHTLRQAAAACGGRAGLRPDPVEAAYESKLDREFRLVIAGSAGGKVRSTAHIAGQAALLSGLWASQADDYPVTVQSGHSLSELIFSPHEILFAGISRPDALVLVSEDGLRQAKRYLATLGPESLLFVPPEFADLETPARKVVLDPAAAGKHASKRNLALLMTCAALRRLDLFPIKACEQAIRRAQRGTIAEENLAVLAASTEV
jgi:Pyruvate/2-oxoacid:ferredoxin oxidoreductase gamma subunit